MPKKKKGLNHSEKKKHEIQIALDTTQSPSKIRVHFVLMCEKNLCQSKSCANWKRQFFQSMVAVISRIISSQCNSINWYMKLQIDKTGNEKEMEQMKAAIEFRLAWTTIAAWLQFRRLSSTRFVPALSLPLLHRFRSARVNDTVKSHMFVRVCVCVDHAEQAIKFIIPGRNKCATLKHRYAHEMRMNE